MVKKRNSGSENTEPVRESNRPPKQPNLVPVGHPQAENRADLDLNEQLRTEVEELRGQVLELREWKHLDERSIHGWEWLARIAEENPDPVLQVSQQGMIQYRNPASFALCRQWNPSDELIVPPAVHEIIKAACASAEVIRQEMTIGDHTYLITVTPAPAPAKYVNIYANDITARKRAEEMLQQQADLLNLTHDTIFVRDTLDRITFWNRGAEECYGWSAAEALGQVSHTLLATQFPKPLEEILQELRAMGQWEGELVHTTRDGRRLTVASRWSLQRSSDGIPVATLEINNDITERKQAEEVLKIKDSAIASSVNAIAMADLQGCLTYVNPAFLRLWGYGDEHEVLGRSVLDFWEKPERASEVMQAIRNGGGWVGELVAVRKDGARRNLYLSTSTVRNDEGAPICMMGSFVDVTERKQAEEALRESEERLRQALGAARMGAWQWEVGTEHVVWSPELYALLGYGPVEVTPTHQTFRRRIHPQDLARWEQTIRGSMERGEDYSCEFRVVWADGSVHWVEARGRYAYTATEGGTKTMWMRGVMADIEQRKQAEEALRESEERLTATLHSMRDEVWIVDAQGRIVLINEAVQEHLGIAPDRWEDVHAAIAELEIFLPDGTPRPAEQAPLARALRGEVLMDVQEMIRNLATGELRWREVTSAPIRDQAGQITGAVAVARDITERKRAGEMLRESEERLRFVVESSPDTIFVQDRDLHYVWMNRPTYPLTHEKLLGHTDMEVLRPEDAAKLTEIKQRVLAQGQRQTAEVHLTWEGQIRFYEAIFAPWRDAAGAIIGVAGYARDITERKQAEEELRKLTATLESKVIQRTAELRHRAQQLQKLTLEMSEAEDRERKRLAAILHDDVQQIIAAAKFHLTVIRNRVKDDASLSAIGEQIDQMLKEAVEKSRGLSHELSPAALYGDFAEALDQLARQMQAKHGLVVQVHAPGPVHLQSDVVKAFIYRAAQELLFNAVKHAQVKEASIRVRRLGRCLCLTVSDRGRGFDPQELREAAGFGLLSIRERIELLGGRMKIKSARGKGSKFFIIVPDGEAVAPEPVHA